MGFHDQLRRSWAASNSLLCVGLDPDPARFPTVLDAAPDAMFRFCKEIVDATADLVCAFKPQIAYFSSQREEAALERLCTYILEEYPDVTLILDAKRGDIGSTAEHYAREAFGRYQAHAVTVNPYLGADSVVPYFAHGGGVIALCRTSNPGGDDLQALDVGGRPLYVRVAEMVAGEWARARRLRPRRRRHVSGRAAQRPPGRRRPADPRSRHRRPGRRPTRRGRRREPVATGAV